MQNIKQRKQIRKIPQAGRTYAMLQKRIIPSVHQLTYDLLDFYQTTGGKILTTTRLHGEKAMLLGSLD